ncbi:tumor necrosis factor receptor superfamily member 10A-like [Latimeria chalumnae]|uniref:tumor necrosis factor receptor superfamily member 10A-like n=1 Tax=Latimeria chalumnae TaxID=7897 RepID=UPI0003C1AAFC|nr:PREDICTED: tumor necrosis factor receptor superfamily member 10A-like [Latimeria chalumnae]|eukprot:XP_005992659.1 PREDICTED: tumor necrosis factor receptor superfamily member 10A-like [Latimeria chalumnae]
MLYCRYFCFTTMEVKSHIFAVLLMLAVVWRVVEPAALRSPALEEWTAQPEPTPGGLVAEKEEGKHRAVRETCGKNQYLFQKGHCCLMCPKGHYVKTPCVAPNISVICAPCIEGKEYTEDANGLERCLSCRRCRKDQDVVSVCTAEKNTVCQCKQGTFCQPNRTCEICQRCKTSCPKDLEKLSDCNATTDLTCGPSLQGNVWIIVGPILAFLVLSICVVFFYWRCHRANSAEDSGSLNILRRATSFLTPVLKGDCQETHDNVWNTNIDEAKVPLRGKLENATMTGCSPTKKEEVTRPLVAAKELPEVLTKSFYTFINEVPNKEWKKFMRLLHLTDNEIWVAERNHPSDIREQYFQMLNTWQSCTGKEASINTLLQTLRDMNLKGVEERITASLIQEGIYKYSTEN